MRIYLIIIFSFFFCAGFAQQSKLDSLYSDLKNATEDSVRLNIRCKIGQITPVLRLPFWDSLITDSKKLNLKRFEAIALNGKGSAYDEMNDANRSIDCFDKGLKIYEELGDKKEIGKNLHILGYIYYDQGNAAKALEYYQKSLKAQQEINFKEGIGEALNNIGFIYQTNGDISQALDYFIQAIKTFEEINDKKNTAYLLNNIAFLYQGQGDTTKALSNYIKCLNILKKLNDRKAMAGTYNNLALIYQYRGDIKKALGYSKEGLTIRKTIGDKKGMAASLTAIGAIYEMIDDKNSGNYDSALHYFLQAFEIRKVLNEKAGFAKSYNDLGNVYFKRKEYVKAMEYGQNSMLLSKELGFPSQLSNTAKLLYKVYKHQNKMAQALEMHEIFVRMRDSINNVETRKSSVKKQFQYEYDRKVTADSVRTGEEKKLVAIKLKQEKTQRYALYGGFILVLIFAFFMFNRFRITQKQKVVIEQQKNIVEEKQREILDSINYAKRLQDAILPAEIFWRENFKNGFVFYKPKDIVAGDFYWLEKINDTVLFAVADCTGHGVPGALVSVVCSNALNRTVLEFGIIDPGKILDKTRELVIATFEKSGEEVKDGMDISLCCLNVKTKELLWAGANNSLWYVKANEIKKDLTTNAILEIKADKQPIGKYDLTKPFTTHKVQLNEGDIIYLFSDGIADQFGGPKGKKFKYKKLKEILLANITRSMDEQQLELETTFNKWKGDLEQIDDVCVIGMKI
ncbi:MAG: tetratricopeptide repeat protein [Bacteroidia bacterium]